MCTSLPGPIRKYLSIVHIHICTCNVSVVRINGTRVSNIIRVGAATVSCYVVARFGARARAFEPCKCYVAARFGACEYVHIRFRVQVSDIICRMIGFVPLMYPLYG